VDALLKAQPWAEPCLDLHTVNDKSTEQFATWIKAWNQKTGLALVTTPAFYNAAPADLQRMTVLERKAAADQTFILTIRPCSRVRFTSGDLLAVYPAGDGRERFYSIGRVDDHIQLVVKLHPSGFGSSYLHALEPGTVIQARIVRNPSFHLPSHAPVAAMIANGTGIAPFLGMVQQNRRRKTELHLYCGFQRETDVTLEMKGFAALQQLRQQLKSFHIVYSRESRANVVDGHGDVSSEPTAALATAGHVARSHSRRTLPVCEVFTTYQSGLDPIANIATRDALHPSQSYVTDLVQRDAGFFADLMKQGGVVMICGSQAMQRDVEAVLDAICLEHHGLGLAHYKLSGQVLSDCY